MCIRNRDFPVHVCTAAPFHPRLWRFHRYTSPTLERSWLILPAVPGPVDELPPQYWGSFDEPLPLAGSDFSPKISTNRTFTQHDHNAGASNEQQQRPPRDPQHASRTRSASP